MGMHVINISCSESYSLSYLTSRSVDLILMHYLQFESPIEYRVAEQSNRVYTVLEGLLIRVLSLFT